MCLHIPIKQVTPIVRLVMRLVEVYQLSSLKYITFFVNKCILWQFASQVTNSSIVILGVCLFSVSKEIINLKVVRSKDLTSLEEVYKLHHL